VDGHHANGALGMDPLDSVDQRSGNPQAEDRGVGLEARKRMAKAVLF
jgi:hypothetical protein